MADRPQALRASILTVSDSVASGGADDLSGPAIADRISGHHWIVLERQVCADGISEVTPALRQLLESGPDLILTTGGTGFGPRDLTPEATAPLLERSAPGVAEAIRASSAKGVFSRGVAGTVGSTLIINLPGSPAGALESLDAVIGAIPHITTLLNGGSPHPR